MPVGVQGRPLLSIACVSQRIEPRCPCYWRGIGGGSPLVFRAVQGRARDGLNSVSGLAPPLSRPAVRTIKICNARFRWPARTLKDR